MKKITQEFIAKSESEILKEVVDMKNNIAKLEIENKVREPKDTNEVVKLKKRVAVAKTILRQKELGITK